MKRPISLMLILILSVSESVLLAPPSQAIFGLSGCEKAKSQISDLENKIQKSQSKILGYNYTNNIQGYDQKIFILSPESISVIDGLQKLDPIPKIWKIAYNNPKCFTNTQKLRVKELGKMTTSQLASYYKGKKYTYSNYCKGADGFLNRNEKKINECFLENVFIVSDYLKYESIYTY